MDMAPHFIMLALTYDPLLRPASPGTWHLSLPCIRRQLFNVQGSLDGLETGLDQLKQLATQQTPTF